ncbi:Glucose-6-phosphate 1-dehydrogenase [Buchnera aphidicola (Cinara kochiana kochiana)]|uniref:Glucose-6-phosphate 1-dehydrogenase n=1 Tax=Buchnera aphidicola (Cinara kochiana kochiana) TaxID=2518976 RepID=A0A451D5Z0_9GAMM|nr:glucose-6-phosphate dehydrogenase [Buchnera aphidicola]VFP81124.1 Glucose-6-phosphate 1-dehydrogenase [Buchnera aphidicola (Cinara kochiana kochiana)]
MTSKKKNYNLFIFGTKGDLVQRKIFSALYRLEKKNKLTNNVQIIGISRSSSSNKEYINIIYNALKKFLNETIKLSVWNKFKKRFIFCKININKIQNFKKLIVFIKNKYDILIHYFAVSSDMFVKICKGLASIQCNKDNSKIIIEKPIGKSLNTFYDINQSIKKYFSEKQIFRIDHYLGKEAILNLISLKFANPLFYNILNKDYVDHVQITLSESIGIENRWNYFDQTGQIIDMVQNHILQIISIFAMNTPKSLHKNHIYDEKIKILKSLRNINKNNIHKYVSLGQYSKGIINNQPVLDYLHENKAQKNSITETFVAMKLYLDTKIWKNVPFYIRTGKRLKKKCSKIVIFLKKTKNMLFNNIQSQDKLNRITVDLQSTSKIAIKLFNKIPKLDSSFKLKPLELSYDYKKFFPHHYIPEEYERLLTEIMQNNKFLFVHQKEIIYSWKWIDPIIQAYQEYPSLLQYYSAGTWGPESSHKLIQQDNKNWDNH